MDHPFPEKEQDLVGRTFECFICKEEIPITSTGAEHYGKSHWLRYSLSEILWMANYNRDFEFRLLFGEHPKLKK